MGEDTPEGGASKRGHPGAWILLGLTVLPNALLALATDQASPAPCGAGFPFCSSDREDAEILWFLVDLVIALIWLSWGSSHWFGVASGRRPTRTDPFRR